MKTKYLNLGMVFCLVMAFLLHAYPAQAQTTEWPPDSFWNEPADPSIFDSISFGLYGFPPPEWKCLWNFGDGTTYNECWVNQYKQYKQDGDYTVNLQVINSGESVSISRVISVRTHDVSIAKFTVPQSASMGQTRQLSVSVRNTRYLEVVQVELYKITANGLVWVGTLIQTVPVRSGNRTTTFNFSYTFTAEDARVGKVTFKAMAYLLNDVREAWPADNEVIALPTRVSR